MSQKINIRSYQINKKKLSEEKEIIEEIKILSIKVNMIITHIKT